MKPTLLLLLIVGLASTDFCCAEGESDKPTVRAAATGSISGRVVDANKHPLRNSQVWLHILNEQPPGFGPATAKSKVDESGNFSFSDLDPTRSTF